MFFQHVYDKSLAQGSYFIGCQATGESIVIDAQRDIDVYLKLAKENNMRITHIAETHIHADFLAGSRELAFVTGAELYLTDEGGEDWKYEFPHTGLRDKDVIKVGNLSLAVMHTPGHTPESISFLLTDHPASDEPIMVFTGDFVFVGDIGRPDLLEKAAGMKGSQQKGAEQMYHSIQKFAQLPDHIQVWPGHGAGSACGKALGAVPSSTVGYEKLSNWAFKYENDKEGFIDYLLSDQPEPPKYFAMMKKLNKIDRPLLVEVPKHPQLSNEDAIQAYERNLKIIDTRSKEEYGKGFLPKSLQVVGNDSFSTWMGWFMNYQEQIILVSEEDQIEDFIRKLMRIGLDNIYGYIKPEQVSELGIPLSQREDIDDGEVAAKVNDPNVQIVDVRSDNEFKKGHIHNADHIFLGTLTENLDKIDKNKEVIVHCQSGVRAAMAHSILSRHGVQDIKTYLGSMNDWIKKGHEVVKN